MFRLLLVAILLLVAAAYLNEFSCIDDTTVEESLRASIGNGYVATVVGSDTVYISGVFSGDDIETSASHRARVPSTSAIKIISVEDDQGKTVKFTPISSTLDIFNAKYTKTWNIEKNGTPLGSVTLSTFASRYRQAILATLLSINATTSLTLYVTSNTGEASQDIDFITKLQGNTLIMVGNTTEPSYSGGVVEVASVSTALPPQINVAEGLTSITLISSYRTSLETATPVDAAMQEYVSAMKVGYSELYDEHTSEWQQLWRSGFEVSGRDDIAAAVNTSLYYMLSSIRDDLITSASLSPGSLSSNAYNGHSFWDTETWMFPALLAFHPSIAKEMLRYRYDRLPGARQKAVSYDPPYAGAMFPWESSSSGEEVCPTFADTGLYEQHISGDIALAVRSYYWLMRDEMFMTTQGRQLLEEIATFFASRVRIDEAGAHIDDVIPPDEYARGDDSVYTNAVATIALRAAAAYTKNSELAESWRALADDIVILTKVIDGTDVVYHPEYDGYNGDLIKQADVVLMNYPLEAVDNMTIVKNDLDFYEARTDENGPAMTWAMHAIGHLSLGEYDDAAIMLNKSFANVHPPFLVWTETPTGGAVNFITGAGGFIQGLIYGYMGMRIREDGLYFTPTVLPGEESTAYKARGLHFLSAVFSVEVADGRITFAADDSASEGLLKIVQDDLEIILGSNPVILSMSPCAVYGA